MADETSSTTASGGTDREAAIGRAPARRRSSAIWRRRTRTRRTSPRGRRRTEIFPAQESLQVLHRENRRHQLQGLPAARAVRGRKRQDRAAALDGRLRTAPAPAVVGHQAGPQHRTAAVRRKCIVRKIDHGFAGRSRIEFLSFDRSGMIGVKPWQTRFQRSNNGVIHGSHSEGRCSEAGFARRRGEGR